ncbi:hypothetical protein DSL72_006132 [Monilinia vaccinii-corymbosi]|uniref:Conserved oligomeric Golgi complex subunit 8 n=1 Tax=Monilinia vaccinii-corymbosi TaxID=61207 RepID=A0A8A3PH33_9HELO|nr:hypothetical protein DSL72_006132 [Monilinia vaccinii-corymbosi]
MADPLYELLIPYFDKPSPRPAPPSADPTTATYLNRLSTLPLSSLNTSEPESLSQASHSLLFSLQALSKRSHQSVIASSDHLLTLTTTLPTLAKATADLRDALPKLDDAAIHFSENYNNRMENAVLDRRRKALLLSRNVDRLADVLDLPTLLSTAISSSNTTTGRENNTLNYASALDLNAHIKRLHALYPASPLITSVSLQAEEKMESMATNLIYSLRQPSLKLAAAMRTISWLRRVAPELDPVTSIPSFTQTREGALGSLFLVCRLASLTTMLNALSPLRDLADQESLRLISSSGKPGGSKFEAGQQTEKYLKRYIEIFREQSFAIISMFRSIFPPATTPVMTEGLKQSTNEKEDDHLLGPLPSALATFPLQLVGMLEETLKTYLPNVRDKSGRDSLLTQVLYCAGSLGRLGGDFSLVLAGMGSKVGPEEELDGGQSDDDNEEEWAEVIKKHRVLAGKLESMVGSRGE